MDRRDMLKIAGALTGSSALAGSVLAAQTRSRRNVAAPFITADDGTQLFCRDWGSGRPVVFLSGWGLPSDFWSYVMAPLAAGGLRCVAFDRRGHGRSTDPGQGYDYDTLAEDVRAVLDARDLEDVTLVAHSMAGGEAVRYLTRHGPSRVAKVVLVGTTMPYVSKSPDNPEGVDPALFEQLRAGWLQDFPQWLRDNARPFVLPTTSEALMSWTMGTMLQTSLQAIVECNRAMTSTDFREELRKLTTPTLVIHGDRDVSAPLPLTGAKTAKLLPNAQLKIYAGPHGLPLTHAAQLVEDVRAFTSR